MILRNPHLGQLNCLLPCTGIENHRSWQAHCYTTGVTCTVQVLGNSGSLVSGGHDSIKTRKRGFGEIVLITRSLMRNLTSVFGLGSESDLSPNPKTLPPPAPNQKLKTLIGDLPKLAIPVLHRAISEVRANER